MGDRPGRLLRVIAFVAFVSLGLPDGVLGVAWPSICRTFALPLSQLGVLLAAATAGYLASSFASGWLVARIGVGRLLLWSSLLMVGNSLGYALAPAWQAMVACGVLAGLGAGAIDAGINTFAAARLPPHLVTWLHASYGLGAMLGPVLMTTVLGAGLSWRAGYAVIGVLLAGMATCFAVTSHLWRMPATPAGPAPAGAPSARPGAGEPRPLGLGAALRRPAIWMNVVLFFVYTGLEVTAGQWTYTLMTEARGVSPALAGTGVAAYWGSLTVGRLVAGAATRRLSIATLLRVAMLGASAAAAMIWVAPGWLIGLVGLSLLGFFLAPVFPLLIAETPGRVGPAHASHAIGFQIAAAYVGTAAIPGAAGILAHRIGLEVLGPCLLALTLALWLLNEGPIRRSRTASVDAGAGKPIGAADATRPRVAEPRGPVPTS